MSAKQLLKSLLPPALTDLLRPAWQALSRTRPRLTYAPLAWETRPDPGWGRDYDFPEVVERERRDREVFIQRLRSGSPLSVDPGGPGSDQSAMVEEHNEHMTYGYALALAARQKQSLKVLDYGGSMGDRYWLPRRFCPGSAWSTTARSCRPRPSKAAGSALRSSGIPMTPALSRATTL